MKDAAYPEREALPEQSLEILIQETPPEDLHNYGWIEFNRSDHDKALAARSYAQKHLPPELQQAFLDGVVFLHYVDTAQERQKEISEAIDQLLYQD